MPGGAATVEGDGNLYGRHRFACPSGCLASHFPASNTYTGFAISHHEHATGAKHVTRQYGSNNALKQKWDSETYLRPRRNLRRRRVHGIIRVAAAAPPRPAGASL